MDAEDFHPPIYWYKIDPSGKLNNSGRFKVTNSTTSENSNANDKFNPPLGDGGFRVPLDATSIYFAFQVMKELMRPGEEGLWQQFASSQTIA